MSVTKVVCRIDVSVDMLDVGPSLIDVIDDGLRRYLNPWEYPDTYRWPSLDAFLFPWVTRLANWIKTRRSTPMEDA